MKKKLLGLLLFVGLFCVQTVNAALPGPGGDYYTCPPHEWGDAYKYNDPACSINIAVANSAVLTPIGTAATVSATDSSVPGVTYQRQICGKCGAELITPVGGHSLESTWTQGGSSGSGLSWSTDSSTPAGVYNVTFKTECKSIGCGASGSASASITVIAVKSLVATGNGQTVTSKPGESTPNLYVPVGTTVTLNAASSSGQWPAGQPTWSGCVSGSGNSNSFTPPQAQKYIATVSCGTSSATVNIFAVEMDIDLFNDSKGIYVPDAEEDSHDLNVAIMGSESDPHYVKVRLSAGVVNEGTVRFSINDKTVEAYTSIGGSLLKNREFKLSDPSSGNDLGGLKNGGTVELFLKLLNPGEVTAQLEYSNSGSSKIIDKVSFTIVGSCACKECLPGATNYLIGSVNSEIKLGTNGFGKPDGSIWLNVKDLNMDMVDPKMLQILAGEATTVIRDGDNVPTEINTGVDKVTFSYETQEHDGENYYKSNT
ncbi:MAG: hypothetical protein WC071_13390, partial [Victivallaceae bacterium]